MVEKVEVHSIYYDCPPLLILPFPYPTLPLHSKQFDQSIIAAYLDTPRDVYTTYYPNLSHSIKHVFRLLQTRSRRVPSLSIIRSRTGTYRPHHRAPPRPQLASRRTGKNRTHNA